MNEFNFEKFIPYHILSRAIDKKTIFSNSEDCSRFVFQMYAVNIGKPGFNLYRVNMEQVADMILNGKEIPERLVISNDASLVDILSFSLVDNHVHFILSPNVENGIPRYIQKLNLGFAKYFNMKYNRAGVLFNKPYKIVPLKTNIQLDAVMRYINIKNPLDIYNPNWQKGLDNWKEAFDFLENYKFSSYPDLFAQRISKILASKAILDKYLGSGIGRSKIENIDFIEDYLEQKMCSYYPLFLEE